MPKYQILVIDNDISTTKYLRKEFNKFGLEILTANSTREGLAIASQHRPHVIILDPNPHDPVHLDIISKIKQDSRISTTKLIAFSSLKSSEDIQSILKMGFHHFVKKEGDAVPILIRNSLEASEETRRELILADEKQFTQEVSSERPPGSKGKAGKSIVFLSGKGGIGTSSLCANIAHISNINSKFKTFLVDLVLPIGSISTIVGLQDTADIVQTSNLENKKEIPEFLINHLEKPHNWNFRLLAGSDSPSKSDRLDISKLSIILDNLKMISDYLFIDLGKTLSRISIPIIKDADQIVLTLSLDQTTVEHTKAVWKFLKEQGIERNQIYFLINRAVGLEGIKKSEAEETLGTAIQLAVPYMGSNFTLANNLHQPVADKFPQDAVTMSLQQAAEDIIEKIEKSASNLDYFQ